MTHQLKDPVCKQAINSLEKVQTDAVKFIANLRGRTSITEARERLGLELLSKRRRNHRLLSLLNKIFMPTTMRGNILLSRLLMMR